MISKAMNRVLAKQDPEGNFDSPLGIVDEMLFTRGEKIANSKPLAKLHHRRAERVGVGRESPYPL